MTPKEPRSESLLAARIMRAYPTLSCYSAATLAESLCAIERMQRRHAERCCSGEDGGYVRRSKTRMRPVSDGTGYAAVIEHDPEAEERAGLRIYERCRKWRESIYCRTHQWLGTDDLTEHAKKEAERLCSFELQHDPRGRVLLLRLPGEAEANGV